MLLTQEGEEELNDVSPRVYVLGSCLLKLISGFFSYDLVWHIAKRLQESKLL